MYKRILVALDGSEASGFAGQAALGVAVATGARLTVCHVYGVGIHRQRFGAMEPGLPDRYQEENTLAQLRSAHDRLMEEGFRALSVGYVEDFVASARGKGVAAESATLEGRNYVGILHLAETRRADLIALGAHGLGSVGDGMLGSTTSRVLQNAPCDVLVARYAPHDGPILVGVDGSEEALAAVGKAAELAHTMNRPVQAVAVYDPDFHTRVFGVMAHSLSAQRQEEVGLANQEKLHDDIINDGLSKLYAEFLSAAKRHWNTNGVALETILLTGKAYCSLNQQAAISQADMIVVGRYGHHREACSLLGSNAEGLLRTASANVLLVGAVAKGKVGLRIDDCGLRIEPTVPNPQSEIRNPQLVWDEQAQARLQRVPSFARGMAKRAVENAVRELGKSRVSAEDFNDVAARFGMGRPKGDM
ncbi:MAG: universal stress protein [Sedimentisphaerales bacterium]|nr:universal stress protein [Sedimentisphaerales bacterium]